MKVYYNSKLSEILTFMSGFKTMMFFGVIITEESELSDKTLKHEETHVKQYQDCVGLGAGIGIAAMFTLFGFDVVSWWMLWLAAVPAVLYYVIYVAEYLFLRLKGLGAHDAYQGISFERHARWIAETWDRPCNEQHHYGSFGWWKKH